MHFFILAASLISLPIQADVLGGRIGANIWAQSYDAEARLSGPLVDLEAAYDLDDESDFQLYAALEHPIPLIPNILVQHTRSEASGSSKGTGPGVELTDVDLDLSHTDVTAYYEILDNWASLDIGLSVRVLDIGLGILETSGIDDALDIDDVIPMAYAAARFELPFTGWYVQGDANYFHYDGDDVTDWRAALGWELTLGLGLELGYRSYDIDYEAGSGRLKAEAEGIYGGVFWDF